MEIENKYSFPRSRYFGAITMLREDGNMALAPHCCKEIAVTRLGSALHFQHKLSGWNCIHHGMPDFNEPKWLFYTNKHHDGAVRKVRDVLDVLCGHLGLSTPKVNAIAGLEAIVIEADKWFIRSSVTVHMLLTFIRSALNLEKVVTKNVMSYVLNVIEDGKNRRNLEHSTTNDYSHFDRGMPVLKAILDGTSPVVNNYENTYWLVHRGQPNRVRIYWPGIATQARHERDDFIHYDLPLIMSDDPSLLEAYGFTDAIHLNIPPTSDWKAWKANAEF